MQSPPFLSTISGNIIVNTTDKLIVFYAKISHKYTNIDPAQEKPTTDIPSER